MSDWIKTIGQMLDGVGAPMMIRQSDARKAHLALLAEAVAVERERCAKIAEDLSDQWYNDYKVGNGLSHQKGMSYGAVKIAAKIREAGSQKISEVE